MASDLISREALLKTLNDLEATGGHKYYLKGANDVLHDIMPQILADAPAVDAVEVVRCKDCIHRHRGSRAKCTGRRPDEFCSDGERRFKDATD